MREVRFRLCASKNFTKEKKMCLTHEFLDPFVTSRVASECFFSFLSLLFSLVVVDLDDDDRRRSKNAKDLRIGWVTRPIDRRYRLCGGTIFKEEEQRERKRELKGSCLVSFPRQKKNCSLSRLKMFDFFDVSNARERKRGASFFEIRRKEREREGPNS